MSLLDEMDKPASWQKFYDYKCGLACAGRFVRVLEEYISEERYLDVCAKVARDGRLSLPHRSVISKMSSQKKRVVYTYPDDENIYLKRLTHLLLRRYDHLFCKNLYSFRPDRTVKDAVRYLRSVPGIEQMYSYKVDISNYFNSIPIERLVPVLKEALSDDPKLSEFLTTLLEEPCVIDNGKVVADTKGIMAGTPQASFMANLYLKDLDRYFYDRGIPYARYSDDIIVFAGTREEIDQHASFIRGFLASSGLAVNPAKEMFGTPSDGWIFLGFCCRGKEVDIAPASVAKIKAKMRRKTRALKRWSARKGESSERAASAFIRVFNRKLYDSGEDNDLLSDNELTWSKWYFPVISTDKSLKEIDHYAQECVRYLLSGTRGKSRYRVKYDDMKKLGLKSLVNSYYAGQ